MTVVVLPTPGSRLETWMRGGHSLGHLLHGLAYRLESVPHVG